MFEVSRLVKERGFIFLKLTYFEVPTKVYCIQNILNKRYRCPISLLKLLEDLFLFGIISS